MSFKTFLGSTLAILLIISCAECLNLKCAKEQSCFSIKKTEVLDFDWLSSIKTIYVPLMSKLELYKLTMDLSQKDPKYISEASVYYESCLHWKVHLNGTVTGNAFNSQTVEYKYKLVGPTTDKFRFSPVGIKGFSGTAFVTWTDNKTFYVAAVCGDDGEMSWGVGSNLPALPEETVKLIHEHVESLGFKREYFTEYKYDRCNISTD